MKPKISIYTTAALHLKPNIKLRVSIHAFGGDRRHSPEGQPPGTHSHAQLFNHLEWSTLYPIVGLNRGK